MVLQPRRGNNPFVGNINIRHGRFRQTLPIGVQSRVYWANCGSAAQWNHKTYPLGVSTCLVLQTIKHFTNHFTIPFRQCIGSQPANWIVVNRIIRRRTANTTSGSQTRPIISLTGELRQAFGAVDNVPAIVNLLKCSKPDEDNGRKTMAPTPTLPVL